MSEFVTIPIRRITTDEIIEFVEFVISHGDITYVVGLEDDANNELTELVCSACLGNFAINVPADDRGFAALIQLKWGKDPEAG